jgi:hypothetical protein
MPFPNNTFLQVAKYLNIKIANAQAIHDALAIAEANEHVFAEVTAVLAELVIAEARLKAELGSPNHAMIRADVVEWSPHTRAKGLTQNYSSLRQQLANLLDLNWNKPVSGSLGTDSYPTQFIP